MKMKSAFVSLFIGLCAICILNEIGAAESIGRYQMVGSENRFFRIDTVTGQTWTYVSPEELAKDLNALDPKAREHAVKEMMEKNKEAFLSHALFGYFQEVEFWSRNGDRSH